MLLKQSWPLTTSITNHCWLYSDQTATWCDFPFLQVACLRILVTGELFCINRCFCINRVSLGKIKVLNASVCSVFLSLLSVQHAVQFRCFVFRYSGGTWATGQSSRSCGSAAVHGEEARITAREAPIRASADTDSAPNEHSHGIKNATFRNGIYIACVLVRFFFFFSFLFSGCFF